MRQALRQMWSRVWLKGVQFSGRYSQLDRLYLVEDPWNLGDPRELERFAATNALIAKLVPGCASLLEIGCGEGAQTAHFLEVSQKVTGVDVSQRAIARARSLLPEVCFVVAPAETVASEFAGERFDCALACEVLYYSADPAAVVAGLQALSDHVLVTVYEKRLAPLKHLLSGAGWSEHPAIVAGDTRWLCYFWEKPAA